MQSSVSSKSYIRGEGGRGLCLIPFLVGLTWAYRSVIEVCSGAGDTGTPRAPRGLRGDGFGAYGVSVVSGTELHGATAGRGYAAKSCCVKAASPRAL